MGFQKNKIQQPDGSYCYTGPTCRRHGEYNQTIQKAVMLLSPERVENILERLVTQFKERSCAVNLGSYASLDEMGSTTREGAFYCEEHNLYHSFNPNRHHQLFIAAQKQVYAAIKKKAGISKEDAKSTFLIITNTLADNTSVYYYPFFAELKTNAKKLSRIRKAYRGKQKASLLLEAEKLDTNTLLFWYQCGRKMSYTSYEEANLLEVQRSSKEPYLCSFCDKWHVGGGNGETSIPEQLERATKLWENGEYRIRVNAFIADNHLLDIPQAA